MKELSKHLDDIIIEDNNLQNEEVVIRGFMDRYDVTFDEAAEIFEETKKFLELAAEVSDEGSQHIFIDNPLLIIDEMWHTFILHTKQYMSYCFGKFNKFIHHVPTPSTVKESIAEELKINSLKVMKEHEEKLKIQYSRIYDKFGPETLVKWYDTLPQKYTPEYIKSIKRA